MNVTYVLIMLVLVGGVTGIIAAVRRKGSSGKSNNASVPPPLVSGAVDNEGYSERRNESGY